MKMQQITGGDAENAWGFLIIFSSLVNAPAREEDKSCLRLGKEHSDWRGTP